MKEFKVGDLAEIITCGDEHGYNKGDIVRIKESWFDGINKIRFFKTEAVKTKADYIVGTDVKEYDLNHANLPIISEQEGIFDLIKKTEGFKNFKTKVNEIGFEEVLLLESLGFTNSVDDTWYKHYVMSDYNSKGAGSIELILNPVGTESLRGTMAILYSLDDFFGEHYDKSSGSIYLDEAMDSAEVFMDLLRLMQANVFTVIKREFVEKVVKDC